MGDGIPVLGKKLRCVSQVVKVTREVLPPRLRQQPIFASTLRHATAADSRQRRLPPFAKNRRRAGRPLCSAMPERSTTGSLRWGRRDTQEVCRRRADCARPFASALLSRGTCEMENLSDRANFWQVQCSE
jgi:hypothetical protein